MNLRPWFEWLESSALGAGVRSSTYGFALIECFHLLGMVCLLGALLVIDLRLLGVILRRQPVARIAASLAPIAWWGLGVMAASGILLLSSEAVKCFDNPAFAVKMATLGAGLIVLLTVHRRAISDGAQNRWTGALSLVLWFGVALAGRAIAFV